MKYIGIIPVALYFFAAGAFTHQWFHGSVTIYTNVMIPGDKYNRGQLSLDIEFPHGLRLGQIRLPDGGVYPNEKPRWVEVLPNGEEKLWLDRLSFETYRYGETPP